jgi:hypothetical protein
MRARLHCAHIALQSTEKELKQNVRLVQERNTGCAIISSMSCTVHYR